MNHINCGKRKNTIYSIIGAAMEVHKVLGRGLLESVYQEALCIELTERGITYEREKHIPCFYKNHQLKKYFQLDLIVDDVIVELKNVNELSPIHRVQLFNYLRLTHMPYGILINFGTDSLQCERYAYLKENNECVLIDRNMNLAY